MTFCALQPAHRSNGSLGCWVVELKMKRHFCSFWGIVPHIMTDRDTQITLGAQNEIWHRSTSTAINNTTITSTTIADSEYLWCSQASKDAQNFAISDLISNLLTLIYSSWIGAMSDIHGRYVFLIIGILVSSLSTMALFWTMLQSTLGPLCYSTPKSANGIVQFGIICRH